MERKEIIEKKIKQLSKHLSKLDETKKDTASDIIKKLAFQSVALDELADLIIEHGFDEKYQNGENQFGIKQSTYVVAYNKFISSYNQTSKIFLSMFEKDDKESVENDLDFGQFIGKAKATKR